MKGAAEVQVGPEVPAPVIQILQTSSLLRTAPGPTSRLVVAGTVWPLMIHPQVAAGIHARQARSASNDLVLVVAPWLSARDRTALEQADCAYADASGALHIQTPTVLLHTEPDKSPNRGHLPTPKGLGVVSVRLIQHLLQDPRRTWTVSNLTTETGASLGQAHKVLSRLETEGLVLQERAGRSVLRRVDDPGALLDWLTQVPAAGKLHERLKTYTYAPTPDALLQRLVQTAENTHGTRTPWALTGAAAARSWGAGAVVTALPVLMVRIEPQIPLAVAADNLGLDPVDAGHNVLLVRDVGRLATMAPIPTPDVVPVAPRVRVYLDMLTEPRGHDAATLFREAVLDY
ncbi:MAG: hypothetical protein QG608_3241 [Actinomycetota bacterium]|nr:hypothetical protein [Actinomycetota bacterium]